MGFYKQMGNLDLGEISIENIFINDFMPSANGTYVKVYLLGYKYATDNIEVSNKTIAKHLNISIEDVVNAWTFWEKKGVIKTHIKSKESSDFDVEFLSLRQLYIDNNYSTNQSKLSNEKKYVRNRDYLYDMSKEEDIRKMFRAINDLVRREIQPNEKLKILNIMERYTFDMKIIIEAFNFAVKKKNKKNINYTIGILRNWYDKGIVTIEDLKNHFSKSSEKYSIYNSIYKAAGYNKTLITTGDKELFDKWLDKYNFEKEFILNIVKEATKKTSNINMNYVDFFLSKAYNENLREIDKIFNQKKNNSSKNKKRNSFHNFKNTGKNYTNEELEAKLGLKD